MADNNRLIYYKEDGCDGLTWEACFIVLSDEIIDFLGDDALQDEVIDFEQLTEPYDGRYVCMALRHALRGKDLAKVLEENDIKYEEESYLILCRSDDGSHYMGKRLDGPNYIGEFWLREQLEEVDFVYMRIECG